jgi:hypothetical protein
MNNIVTIDVKALKYIKSKNLCFVVKILNKVVECE